MNRSTDRATETARCPDREPHDEHDWTREVWRPLPPDGAEGTFVAVTYHCWGKR